MRLVASQSLDAPMICDNNAAFVGQHHSTQTSSLILMVDMVLAPTQSNDFVFQTLPFEGAVRVDFLPHHMHEEGLREPEDDKF